MISRVCHWAGHILAGVSAVALVLMMAHVAADVVGKYVFNHPIPGTAEVVASYYMVATVFLPLAWVEVTHSSIMVELFYAMFPTRMQKAALILATALSAVFFGGLGWLSWQPAIDAWEIREVIQSTWRVVIWPTKFLLPLGLGLACLILVLRFVDLVLGRDISIKAKT